MRRPHRASALFTRMIVEKLADAAYVRQQYRDAVDLGFNYAAQQRILASAYMVERDLRELREARDQHEANPWLWLSQCELTARVERMMRDPVEYWDHLRRQHELDDSPWKLPLPALKGLVPHENAFMRINAGPVSPRSALHEVLTNGVGAVVSNPGKEDAWVEGFFLAERDE